jgi:hypothetical protein
LGKDLSKQKLELIFWKMEASTKTKVLKIVVNKKLRKKLNRNNFGLNRFGRGKNRTEQKLISLEMLV